MSEIDKPARNFLETEALTFFSRRGFLKTSATVATSMLYGCQAGTEAVIKQKTSQVELAPPTGVEDEAWAEIRAQFLLDPGIAYMNNASLGMPPSQIVASVHAGYEAISREPLHGKHDLQTAITEKVLPGLATLFGVTSGEISLTRNATEALHLQSVGLDLAPGDEVLVTTQEHPAGIRPWMLREAREGIRVSEVFIPQSLPNRCGSGGPYGSCNH
ncbi:MAG: aminotransferase class V-fold PLP-dependent enzyme [Longimicrobiales bacterium]|nr:aminotransferase class V-fold PLP-dependent enzyme [Longimicrobiales bacterium]